MIIKVSWLCLPDSSWLLIFSLALFITGGFSCSGRKNNIEPVVVDQTTLKVMSYNIHIGNPPSKDASFRDLDAIAFVINLEKPDLVALSEVDNKTRRSGEAVDQAKKLAELTGMNFYFTKAMDYQGGEYGDAVLSKLPILDSQRYELPTTGIEFEPRSVAMVTVEKDGQKLHFASTHLDHTRNDENRVLQAKALDSILDLLSDPIILAGDLNAQPGSKPIEIIRRNLKTTCTDNCPLTFPAINPKVTIDHILFSPDNIFNLKELRTVNETYASDHLPLVAVFELLSK